MKGGHPLYSCIRKAWQTFAKHPSSSRERKAASCPNESTSENQYHLSAGINSLQGVLALDRAEHVQLANACRVGEGWIPLINETGKHICTSEPNAHQFHYLLRKRVVRQWNSRASATHYYTIGWLQIACFDCLLSAPLNQVFPFRFDVLLKSRYPTELPG